MKAQLIDLVFSRDGKRIVTLQTDETIEDVFDEFHGRDVEVQIKDYKRKRSLDANGYAWVLIGKLASRLGLTKTEVYQSAIREIGGVSDVICLQDKAKEAFKRSWESNGIGWQCEEMPSKLEGCTNIVVYYGSSSYDSRQMSALIDGLIDECRQYGIETMPEDRLNALLNEWEER